MIVLTSTHRAVLAQRDAARDTAELWHEEALSRAHTINELRGEIAKLKGRLNVSDRIIASMEDALTTCQAQIQRQPVRGQGGRFARRAA